MQTIDHKEIKTVVCVAIVNEDDEILLSQRPPKKHLSGLWEFPGGKVEMGETPENALIREVKEELNIDISQKCIAPLTFSEFDYGDFHLLLLLYICRKWEGNPQSMEKNWLKWVKPNMLRKYAMPPPDDALIYSIQDLF